MVQGFFGNSFSRNLLKSVETNACDFDYGYDITFRYELDEFGRIWGYKEVNEDYTNSYIIEWK